ncbi:hypothetical protein NHP190003_03820 [Helicobacter sp. NHP19-003]|uniref:Uncharacterized protein n=1 Tax=Helicobacter gastrocanis TaxID=2849641 RepID=A0ABN6I0G4_9HELI|nr:hypothetical protein [Helicobacter sp. NHP19-003]BCZ17100.1 hypothetical protein NHP190003_03820 [Helicobacter sp. NHP19-003]
MHVLRARNGEKSREMGLRPFFLNKHRNLLKDGSIMQEIAKMEEYWYGTDEPRKYSLKSNQFYNVLATLESGYWEFFRCGLLYLLFREGKGLSKRT